jgi:DNA-binding CsgD family transcriptional regulator/tetratricopeptide (TPR) repeat protein
MAARAVVSAEDEADVLVTLGIVEWANPTKAHSFFTQGRARAVDAGNPRIEMRALVNLAELAYQLGNLATARALFDEGAELAQRAGLGWSLTGITMRCGQCLVCFDAGDWDQSERLARAVPELVTTLPVAELAAAALPVEVSRGRATAIRHLRDLRALSGLGFSAAVEVAGWEAELATWQEDLDRASSAVQRGLAILDAGQFKASQTVEDVWICAIGLAVQAGLADRARAADDAGPLSDAIAVGHKLLERTRAAVEQTQLAGPLHDVYLRGWHAKAEAEWTRVQGRSDPKAWQAAVEAFSYGHVYEVARCRWRLAEAFLGAGDREQATVVARAAHATAVRLGAEPLRGGLEALARRGRLDLGVRLPAGRTLTGLTLREVEVLRLLVEGRSNRQIAEQLFISGKTASVHVTNILAKLGVHSRLEAAATARRLGLDQPAQEGSAT